MKKVISIFMLCCALVLLSGCTDTTNTASAVDTSTAGVAQSSTVQPTPSLEPTPSETVLSPNMTPTSTLAVVDPTASITADPTSTLKPTKTAKATATAKPTPSPTPISSNYILYKKLAVSSNYSVKQIVGITEVSEPLENTAKDPNLFKLTVDVTNKVVKVYKKVGEEYVLYRLMICTTGQSGYSTPKGTFHLTGYHVRFGFFSKYNCYAQYWSQINGQILFHSILYSRPENNAYRATSYNNLGRAASHGCVRLTVPDAKWVYDNCPKGTEVTIGAYAKDADLVNAVKIAPLK